MSKSSQILCFLIFIVAIPIFGQFNSFLSLRVTPDLNIPLGQDSQLFDTGAGGRISGEISMPFFPNMFTSVDVGYNIMPLQSNITNLSVMMFGTGIGVDINPISLFSIRLFGKGGYFYGFLNDGSDAGGYPFVEGGLGAWVLFSPKVGAGIDAGYRSYLGLSNELSISAGVVINIVPSKKGLDNGGVMEHQPGHGLDLLNVGLDSIFPVFYGYYDNHSVGNAVMKNFEKQSIENIEVTFFVKQYMDNPKKCSAPSSLKPGEEATIDLFGLFTNSILSVSEGTKVSALITTKYTYKSGSYIRKTIVTLDIQNRNALTWDDDRRVAAFVTAKDSSILKFAKNTAGIVKDNSSSAINKNLALAMGIYTALREYGMSYVIDPTTPYAELSGNTEVVDFVQFPVQSLDYKAGDCDDLSILFSALLESVGIETAFITIPGHIYMGFSLGITKEEAEKKFLRPEDLVFMDGGVWVPVEITEIEGGFLKAWQTGAKEWRENTAKLKARFYPTHEAWGIYSAVGFDITEVNISQPEEGLVAKAFSREYLTFVNREISFRVKEFEQEIAATQSLRAMNNLGVLYARYGLNSKAEEQFKRVVSEKEYFPALLNLGNINYLSEDYHEALEYYKKAGREKTDYPKVLLGIARASQQLEQYDVANAAYTRLKTIDPDLAEEFSYLDLKGDEANRAADQAQVKEVMIWEAEE